MIGALALAAALWLGGPVQAAEAQTPAAAVSPEQSALAAFEPLIGRTWRGASISDANIVDELTFERVAGGRAIRSRHSLNEAPMSGRP